MKSISRTQPLTMIDSKQIQQSLQVEDPEEIESLLGKEMTMDKSSIYNLNKMPGVTSPDPKNKDTLPVQLSKDLDKIMRSPVASSYEDDNDASSQQSEDGYLPATLRAAISISNKPTNKDLCVSPPLSKRNSCNATQKKRSRSKPLSRTQPRPRSLRRSKSEKEKLFPKESRDRVGLTKSLHTRLFVPDIELNVEKPSSVQNLERLCRSEELKKAPEHPRTVRRRKSPKPVSRRRSRSHNRKLKNASSFDASGESKIDQQVLDWKRPPKSPTSQKKQESDAESKKVKGRKPSKSPNVKTRKKLNKSIPPSLGVTGGSNCDLRKPSKSPNVKTRKKLNRSFSHSLDATKSTINNVRKPSTSPNVKTRKKLIRSFSHSLDAMEISINNVRKPSKSPNVKTRKKFNSSFSHSLDAAEGSTHDTKRRVKMNKSFSHSLDATAFIKGDADLKKPSPRQGQRKRPQKQVESKKEKVQEPTESTKLTFNPEELQLDVDWKRPSPRQEHRKRSQKQKQVEPEKQNTQKPTESKDAKTKKSKSRRALMLTSKAVSPSCRNLLRKIDQMNDDRISKESSEFKENPESSIRLSSNELSRSTQSPSNMSSRSLTDVKESSKNRDSETKPKEESTQVLNEAKDKPPRTRSAPLRLMRKGKNKSSNDKVPRTSSNKALRTKAQPKTEKEKTDSLQKRSVKKSFSGPLKKMGLILEAMGGEKNKNDIDKTARMGNRSTKQARRKPLRRTKSDTSLGSDVHASNYNLMVSMHSISSDPTKKESRENEDSDSIDNSFSVDDDVLQVKEAVSQEQMKSLSKSMSSLTFGDFKNVEAEDVDKIGELEDSISTHMKSMAKFFKQSIKGKRGPVQGNNNNCGLVLEESDGNLCMAEFSTEFTVAQPKKPATCLQIDFSELSKHGRTGNIVVRSKKLIKSVNKSNQGLLPSPSPTLVA